MRALNARRPPKSTLHFPFIMTPCDCGNNEDGDHTTGRDRGGERGKKFTPRRPRHWPHRPVDDRIRCEDRPNLVTPACTAAHFSIASRTTSNSVITSQHIRHHANTPHVNISTHSHGCQRLYRSRKSTLHFPLFYDPTVVIRRESAPRGEIVGARVKSLLLVVLATGLTAHAN